MEKNAIFITVRTGSTRLKNKSTLKIKSKHTIEYVIDAVKKSNHASDIILCTTTNDNDNILCNIAEKNNIKYFRGSEKNKWSRWLGACKKFNVKFFVTADGDDLFYSHILADTCLTQYQKLDQRKPIVIDGQGLYNDVYGFNYTAINKINSIENISEIEPHNAIEFLKNNSKEFLIEKIKDYPDILEKKNVRMTLDYPEDLIFFKKVIENIDNADYSLSNIYKIIRNNPEIANINLFLEKEWKENQKR